MISFYNSLPWPVYLLVSFGVGILLIQYFSRNIREYTIPFSIGIILMSCSSIFAGIVRVFYLLGIQWNLNIVESLPLFGFIGLPLIFVGGYLKTKDDPEKRRIILFSITIATICLLMIGIAFLIP